MFKVMFIDDDPMVLRMASFMMKKKRICVCYGAVRRGGACGCGC